MTLHGVVLAKILDNFCFVKLLPVVFGTLCLYYGLNPLFFRPKCVTFQVSFVNIELGLEFLIHSSHIHQLLLSQVCLECMVFVLLSL